jgi:uncharacterized membrane protein
MSDPDNGSNWRQLPQRLRFLICILLTLGVFFRFIHLDQKIYWIDETFTSLRISGYTESELIQHVSSYPTVSINYLQEFQQIHPDKTVVDTVQSLAIEEPQLTPLYFILVRLWAGIFGDSVAEIRSFSAVMSLLAFPVLYYLCLEVFQSARIAWISISLLAVSPFHVLFAQEARPYSLLTVLILLSSTAFLQAIRLNRKRDWFVYTITLILGIYAHLFFAFIPIGHIIYIGAAERFKWTQKVTYFSMAVFTSLVTFSPWIWAILYYSKQVANKTNWQTQPIQANYNWALVKSWLVNISLPFMDFNRNPDFLFNNYTISLLMLINMTIFVGYTLYFISQDAPRKVQAFLFLLISVTSTGLLLPDLIGGGLRSTVSRYLIPCFLGIEMAVAYLFAAKITSEKIISRYRKEWKIAFVALLSVGIFSCLNIAQSPTWWIKNTSNYNQKIAQIINSSSHPLIINDLTAEYPDFQALGNLLSLSHVLKKTVELKLVIQPNIPEIPITFKDIFLYSPSPTLLKGLTQQKNLQVEPILQAEDSQKVWLWKVHS